jgi:hypothetical protein
MKKLAAPMKSLGNLILMTLICLVIFWIFMALRPAQAQLFGPPASSSINLTGNPYGPGGAYYGGNQPRYPTAREIAAARKKLEAEGVYLPKPRGQR